MGYGFLTEKQKDVVKNYITKEVVFDLGAGDCELAVQLLNLGASRVIAVEKEPFNCPDKIEKLQIRFQELVDQVDSIDVCFISWPNNQHNSALITLTQLSKIVIYLGSNTNGNACASPRFFQKLLHREVLNYIPNPRNTLIIYGDELKRPRNSSQIYGEEFAALTIDQQSHPLFFDEVEDLV